MKATRSEELPHGPLHVILLIMTIGAIYPILWVSVYAAGMAGSTTAWTIAGAVFDARQAKRLFPLATSAAIAGGFLFAPVVGFVTGLVRKV